jgi:hypothetical protein
VFSNGATFCTSSKVNRHNLIVWGTKNHVTFVHQRDLPTSWSQVYGSFFFAVNTINGINYLDMLQKWLMPQLTEHDNTVIFQQDEASLIFTRVLANS